VSSPIHRCPKCGTYFKPARDPQSECPSCGIFFHKWVVEQVVAGEVLAIEEDDGDMFAPHAFNPVVFYGRVVALALVTMWGIAFAAMDYKGDELTRSFMHLTILPIHEAGHIFFMPFGEWMSVFGGSFFQVALPAGIAIAFLWKQRDPFGAAITTWWTGASLVDLSVYIYDALHPQLILTSGTTGENGSHDWIYLLGGQLRHAQGYGTFVHHVGVLVMAAGIAWAGWYCWRAYKERPAA